MDEGFFSFKSWSIGLSIARQRTFSCPIERAIFAIGARWKPRIIWSLRNGVMRFSDIRECVPGLSDRMLQLHLRELADDGITIRLDDRAGWKLTERGLALEPALRALFEWGSKDVAVSVHDISAVKLDGGDDFERNSN
jgi:DNA-binding HxlR family transcriptional regulator